MSQLEPGAGPDGKQILWLKRLVTWLTVTMIAGIAILVTLALSAFLGERPAADWPDTLALPQGETLQALTRSDAWLIAVTRRTDGTEQVHILEPGGETIRQTIALP